jgi:hypothetical protein
MSHRAGPVGLHHRAQCLPTRCFCTIAANVLLPREFCDQLSNFAGIMLLSRLLPLFGNNALTGA